MAGLGLLRQAAQPLGLVANLGEAGEALGYGGAVGGPTGFRLCLMKRCSGEGPGARR
jgi:hypothetical protein